jgi:apolipoprotein N-acyltransferase
VTRRSTVHVLVLGGLAGALYALAFPPYGLAPIGAIALVPLIMAVRRAPRPRLALAAGAMAGIVASIGSFFWIAGMAHRFWQVPWVFAVFLLLLFGTFAEIHFTAFAWVTSKLRPRLAVLPAAVTAALYTLLEAAIPKIFPDALGHAAVQVPWMPHASAYVGTYGLTFALAWTAAAIAWRGDAARGRVQRHVELVLSGCGLVVLVVLGGRRDRKESQSQPERALEVLIVQSNLGDPEELAARLGSVTAAIDSVMTLYENLTREGLAAGKVDVVVWPETAVPAVPRPRIVSRLAEFARRIETPLVFGAYDAVRQGDRFLMYNAAYHLTAAGELQDRYYKHKLLVFGEYVPLSARFPALLNLLPSPGEFMPGPGPGWFHVAETILSPLICYELLFPRVVRRSLRTGSEVLLNLTNDYWFGRRGEPMQHLTLSRMRAFETGRPVIRATNTGISALVDGRGRVLQRTEVWQRSVLRGTLPVPAAGWTPYARWGEWTTAAWIAAAIGLVGSMWRIVPGHRESA